MPPHRSGPPAKRLREYATSSDSIRGLSLSNVFQRAWHEWKKVIIFLIRNHVTCLSCWLTEQ